MKKFAILGAAIALVSAVTLAVADWSPINKFKSIQVEGEVKAGTVVATTITGATVGNASTATALAANGANCSAGSAPIGVDASGAAESCTDYEAEITNSAGLLAALDDETGTGVAVFGTTPTIGTAILTAPTITLGNLNGAVPATQVIGAGGTIAADACGGIKRISSATAVTTDTTNTFTAPAAANAGCVLNVCNENASDAITLDNNALFQSAAAGNVVVGALDCVQVVSSGGSGKWYQISALQDN